MSTTFKIIKTTPFNKNGFTGTHYSVAYKARVLGVSTLSFSDTPDDLKVNGDQLTISGDLEIRKKENTTLEGKTMISLNIVPALGIAVGV